MNIMGFLDDRAVSVNLQAHQNKEAVIRELAELLVTAGAIKDKDTNKLVQILLKRESLGSKIGRAHV